MQYYPFTLSAVPAATDTTAIETAGAFVRYDEETSGAANNKIIFRTDNGDYFILKPGQSVELERQFKRFTLENKDKLQNLAGQIVVTGVGRVNDSNIVGNLTLTGPAVGVTLTPNTKTAAAASAQALAANASRKVLKVQLQSSAVNSIFIHSNGGPAVADTTCWELLPGQSWEPIVPPTGAIFVIRNGGVDIPFHVEEG